MADQDVVPLSPRRRLLVVFAVMTGMFLTAMETTVVGTAMPTVVSRLGGIEYYSWVFTTYLLATTITGPIWGKLSDSHGRLRIFTVGTAIFLAGSALAGQSRSMGQLVFFRTIQGVGAGATMPVCLTILGDIFSLQERARFQAYISSIWGIASIAGPLIGGFLTDHLSWRWIFYVNVPVGLVAMVAMRAFREPPQEHRSHRLDVRGALSLSLGVLALLVGLGAAGRQFAWISLSSAALFGCGGFALAYFVREERRAPEPIIAPSLFSIPLYTSAALVGVLSGMALYTAITFLPLYVQAVVGTTATRAGAVLTPMMLTWVLCNAVVARLMISMGYRFLVTAGSCLLLSAFGLMAALGTDGTWPHAAGAMVLMGCGMSCMFMPMTVAVQGAVARSHRGMATSSIQFFRSIGGAIGVAVLGALLAGSFEGHLDELLESGVRGLTPEEVETLAREPGRVVDPVSRATLAPAAVPAVVRALALSLDDVFLGGVVVAFLLFLSARSVPGGRASEHLFAPRSVD